MSCQIEEVSDLLKRVENLGKSLNPGAPEKRKEILAVARKLCLALETPIEAILRMEWAEVSVPLSRVGIEGTTANLYRLGQPTLDSATRVAIQLGLFDQLKEAGKSGFANASSHLAKATGADVILLSRILKHLASMGMILEVGSDMYAPTALSDALTIPKYRDGITHCFDINTPAIHSLPKYLAQNEYKNPVNLFDGPFQVGHSTSKHLFEYLGENPQSGVRFNNHMEGYTAGRAVWYGRGCVPVNEILGATAGSEKGEVLLVDIGGGTGRDIVGFHKQFPDIPGRLVLQDLPAVIADAKNLPQAVEPMAHDFFSSQPIKGAHAYYMHSVLHDWPEEKCQEILRGIIPSMKKGYSKILINENVIPDMDAHWLTTSLDIVMMSVVASCERTEGSWRRLLSSVGLTVVKIWTYEKGSESLIEAELT